MRKPHIKLTDYLFMKRWAVVRRDARKWKRLSEKEKQAIRAAHDFIAKLNRKLDEESLEKHLAKLEAKKNAKV